MKITYRLTVFICILFLSSPAFAIKVLFDGSHGETAGNADWIVDAIEHREDAEYLGALGEKVRDMCAHHLPYREDLHV